MTLIMPTSASRKATVIPDASQQMPGKVVSEVYFTLIWKRNCFLTFPMKRGRKVRSMSPIIILMANQHRMSGLWLLIAGGFCFTDRKRKRRATENATKTRKSLPR